MSSVKVIEQIDVVAPVPAQPRPRLPLGRRLPEQVELTVRRIVGPSRRERDNKLPVAAFQSFVL
jgi:hypothetical protein